MRRKTLNWSLPLALVFFLLLLPSGALAQSGSDEWEFRLYPLYVWGVSIDGSTQIADQGGDIEIDFGDAIDKLEATFTVHFEAWKGNWGIFTDFSWIDLGDTSELNQAITLDAGVENFLIELAGARKLGSPTFATIFGVRYYGLDIDLRFTQNTPVPLPFPPEQIEQTIDIYDGFVGFLWRPPISSNWTFDFRADIGAGSSDVVYNVIAALDWRITRRLDLLFGYRYFDLDYEEGQGQTFFQYKARQTGPLVALGIQF